MVRLRQRQRFRSGARPAEEAEGTAVDAGADDRPRVTFRRTGTLRGSNLPNRSTLWLVALLAIVVTAILLLG